MFLKARYTLATKSNLTLSISTMSRFSRCFVESRLSPARSTLPNERNDYRTTTCMNVYESYYDLDYSSIVTSFRLCRPSVQTVAKVAMNMFNSAVDFIQFDKIDRIEFDFVASVYRALV